MKTLAYDSVEWAGKERYDKELFALGGYVQRVCFVLQIRPERLEEYKQKHRCVWPEMMDALRESGWINYSLFLRQDGMLIGYLETEDFTRAVAAMASQDVNKRWQTEMMPFFVGEDGHFADQLMIPIDEVFHLDPSDVLETTR